MRPWMVGVMMTCALGVPVRAPGAEPLRDVPASIRRVGGAVDLASAVFEMDVRGLRFRLDLYLGPTGGGYHAFASSAAEGQVRAWFDPGNDSWFSADPDGLVRTFSRPPGSATGDAWPLTRVEDGLGNWLAVVGPPS